MAEETKLNADIADYFTTNHHGSKVLSHKHGLIDLSTLSLKRAKELVDAGFPYLKLTEAGMNKFAPKPKGAPEKSKK